MKDLIMKANNIEDKRQEWKVKHNLVDILVIVILSVLTGYNDFKEMVIFVEARIEILRKYIKLENGIPVLLLIKKVAFNLNIIRKSVLSILKIIDVGKKYSLKNKIHYINDNFDKFFPEIIK